MSASSKTVTIVHVSVREGESGLFFAESPELKGLLVAEPDMDSLWQAVPGAIRDLYRATGQDVIVARVSDPDSETYAAIPEDLLRRPDDVAGRAL